MTETNNVVLSEDLIWGVEGIAQFLGIPLRRAYYMIERDMLPYRRHGHKTITASRRELREHFLSRSPAVK